MHVGGILLKITYAQAILFKRISFFPFSRFQTDLNNLDIKRSVLTSSEKTALKSIEYPPLYRLTCFHFIQEFNLWLSSSTTLHSLQYSVPYFPLNENFQIANVVLCYTLKFSCHRLSYSSSVWGFEILQRTFKKKRTKSSSELWLMITLLRKITLVDVCKILKTHDNTIYKKFFSISVLRKE